MCFAPQHRALFQHLNFQKRSDPEVFCTFSLRNRLRATTACNFSSLISPDVSAPAALASLLFNPPEPQNHEKNTVFRDFPTFSRTCIFFLLIFSLLTVLPADCFFISPYCRKFDFQTSFDYVGTWCISRILKVNSRSAGRGFASRLVQYVRQEAVSMGSDWICLKTEDTGYHDNDSVIRKIRF